MAVSFEQEMAIRNIADILYNFLPASGSKSWKGFTTFETVAKDLNLSHNWIGGSKTPAIIHLLKHTFLENKNKFKILIERIVVSGYSYRKKKNNPLKRKEIYQLNSMLLKLGLTFDSLHNQDFLNTLEDDRNNNVNNGTNKNQTTEYSLQIEKLKEEYYKIHIMENRQQAGYRLEKLLNNLFRISNYYTRFSFRINGEQIDGSVEIDSNIYLIEVKFTKDRISESDLLIFRGKIEGKSSFTRGIFLSISGYTEEAIEAITKGKQPNFLLIDGYELHLVLCGHHTIDELLRHKIRKLAEEGNVYAKLER